MKILLTGACGNLGGAVREVGAGEHEFVLLDVTEQVEADGGTRGSVTDVALLRRLAEGCDAIIHTAAMHGGFRDKATNQQFIETNVVGAENIFEAAITCGVKRIVMSSSLEVIYGNSWDAHGAAIIDENTPPRPDWIYPVTKRQVEVLSSYYAQEHGLEVINLRYSNICNSALRKMGNQLLARGAHNTDHARANILAATTAGLTDHIIHCGPATPINGRDISAALKDPWTVVEQYWPGCSDCLRAVDFKMMSRHFWPVTRIERARQLLGWEPRITFTDYLREIGWTGEPTFQQAQPVKETFR